MKNLIFSCIESRIENSRSIYGYFKLGPFYFDQGLTIANTLRRILLSDLSSWGIVFVKIEGVKHEYSIIKGVQESVLEFLTNLKRLTFKVSRFIYKPQLAYLDIHGPTIVRSGDIKLPFGVYCVDPDLYIATLSSVSHLKVKIFICRGQRYFLQNSLKFELQKSIIKTLNLKNQNYLFLDPVFLPVNKVNFIIQKNKRLMREFILLEIWTNGSLHPRKAFYQAISRIIQILIPFRRFQPPQEILNTIFLNKKIHSLKYKNQLLSLDIGNFDLSLQTYSFLKKRNIHTISDLIQTTNHELTTVSGFKEDFLREVEVVLQRLGLCLKI